MRFSHSASALPTLAADILVIAVSNSGLDAAADALGAFGPAVKAAASDDEFSGKAGTSMQAPSFGNLGAKRLLLVGTGSGTGNDLRLGLGTAGKLSRDRGARTVAVAFPGGGPGGDDLRASLEAFAEGNYRFDKYKAESSRKAAAETVVLSGVAEDAATVARAEALIAGQLLARDLVNEPAAEIFPASLAKVAESLASDRITVTVLDEAAIREKGMGGISGVGQGSSRPPRFVHMTYSPAGPAKAHLCLVGKGVTFDSGGLSIKPSDGMLTMRCDMAGAAAVIGAMRAIAGTQPQVRVDAIFGAVENMPSHNAYKLGDILTMYNGKRVEIHNTDAEGRLVLADCLAYASELKPDALVDLATLTGAAVVALGDWYSAYYTRNDALAGGLASAAATSGEAIWRMPLPDLYKDKLKAEWGDLKNVGGRAGGSITAALFLSEFVTVDAWAHVDIAGPAFLETGLMHYVPGATGTMVRTLARWIEGFSR